MLGGAYLLYIAVKNLWFSKGRGSPVDPVGDKPVSQQKFWRVVLAVELMDIAFSVDSILAAVAITQKYWMVLTGGILGIIMMRYAATVFIKLLQRFPRLEDTAYLLVLVIGLKLSVQGLELPYINFHDSNNAASWLFWGSMVACIIHGLKGKVSGHGQKAHHS